MAVTTDDLARFWDDAWDAAPEATNTFRQQIRDFEKLSGRLVSAGSLGSVSKNSSSQTFAPYNGGNLTQAEIARAWRELINLFDRIKAAFIADSVAAPTDEQIYAEGVSQLSNPVTETRPDFSESRCW